MEVNVETKVCTKCKREKEIGEFAMNYASSDLRQSWCRSCHSKWLRDRRAENRKKAKRDAHGTEA